MRKIVVFTLMALLCAVAVRGTALAQVDWKQFQEPRSGSS